MLQPYPITELFAWIVDDPSREHAIMGVMRPDGLPMQATSSRRDLMEKMRPAAEMIARETGHPVRLTRFIIAEVVEEVAA